MRDDNSAKPMAPATAAKYQKDPVWSCVIARFPRALREIARVSAYGMAKHGDDGSDPQAFARVPDAYRVYSDARCRHMLDELIEGERNPRDGHLRHAAQEAWNALARLEVLLLNLEAEAKSELYQGDRQS